MTACTSDKQVDQSLPSVVAQSVAKVVPSRIQAQNLPGHFSVTIDGDMPGDHWDAHGRRYTPQLILMCSGRQTSARLRFAVAIGSTDPLPPRGFLQAEVILGDAQARAMTLTRQAGASYFIEGALPLVHQILNVSSLRLSAVTADGLPLTASFDLNGLKDSIRRYDFFCAKSWLESRAPLPSLAVQRPAIGQTAAPIRADASMRLEAVRDQARVIDGVTSTVWLPDRTLMLGMGNATSEQMIAAVDTACALLRDHPEASQTIEVQDTRGGTGQSLRMNCPR
ncbi:MAG: hypothetical protein ACT4NL_06080 [Pseudomarimonas sp.]